MADRETYRDTQPFGFYVLPEGFPVQTPEGNAPVVVPAPRPPAPSPPPKRARLGGELTAFAKDTIYTSYAGVDIVAQLVMPDGETLTLGELQTISYSIHRENTPVRLIGQTNVAGFVKGPRTIAGSLIFTVFNNYAFYRLRTYQEAIANNLYALSDMLPPFDVVITFANENAVFSKMKIYGITFTDEGGTMSIDDLVTEQTYTYMARGIQPMTGYDPRGSNGAV